VTRRRIVILATIAAVLAVSAISTIAAASKDEPVQQLGTAPFDQAAFNTWWNDPGILPITRQHVTAVDWNSGILVAHTSLFADGDAVEPALKICQALAAYSADKPDFYPVQVMDRGDLILTSRHTRADTCQWRR
jgi:hypothetical protein